MGTTALAVRGVNPKRLTDKQRMFIAEYLVDMNGKRAAIAAGYSARSAKVRAAKLLKHPLVSKAIGNCQRKDLESLGLDRERIVQELACVALRDPIDLCDENGLIRVDDLRQLPERIRRCIDSIKCRQRTDANGNVTQEIELRLSPKTPAIELALKHFGLLGPDKHDVNVKAQFDWDRLYDDQRDVPGEIEQRLAMEEARSVIDMEPSETESNGDGEV